MRAQYGRLLTEAYDLDQPEAPPAELEFVLATILAHAVDGPVLDAMSGSGRFLTALVAAGLDVDGVDSSPDMLAACSWRCRERGLYADLFEQWLHVLDLPRKYGFALVNGGSFGLIIDDDEVRDSLLRLRAQLLPGGALLVEAPALHERRRDGVWQGRWWTRNDGATITNRHLNAFDTVNKVETGVSVYELWQEGRLVESELDLWALRYWTAGELGDALRDAGFERVEGLAGPTGNTTFVAHAPGG